MFAGKRLAALADHLELLGQRFETKLTEAAQLPAGLSPSQWSRIAEVPARLDRIEQRLEEIVQYFGHHLAVVSNSQSTYLGDHTALTRLRSGQSIYVDTRSVDLGSHLLQTGLWEEGYMKLFSRLIRPDDTVLDIGANHGVYSMAAALAAGPRGAIHAFEPNSRLARLVRGSLAINGYGGFAQVHQVAVSDAEGETILSFDPAWSGGGHIGEGGGGHEREAQPCRAVRIDDLFPDAVFRADVIKMDVEGFEGRAIRGMLRLLERSSTVKMMMEFAPAMMGRSGVTAEETVRMLRQLGFRFWSIQHDGSILPEPVVDCAVGPDTVRNILVSRQDID